MSDISVTDAHARWSAGELSIVDVREQNEHDATRVEGMPLIPMGEILDRIDELPNGPLAIFCRSGNRSGQVADHLNAAGEHGPRPEPRIAEEPCVVAGGHPHPGGSDQQRREHLRGADHYGQQRADP